MPAFEAEQFWRDGHPSLASHEHAAGEPSRIVAARPDLVSMDHDEGISALRSRVSALVEREGVLLTQAFELSRGSGGNGHQRLESLFAQVQALQIERNGLKKRIGNMLGTQRLHEAAEVWRPGVYDYRPEAGGDVVRVYVKIRSACRSSFRAKETRSASRSSKVHSTDLYRMREHTDLYRSPSGELLLSPDPERRSRRTKVPQQ